MAGPAPKALCSPLTAEEALRAFILDFLVKNGFASTAKEMRAECARIPDHSIPAAPIDSAVPFLFEWFQVFWGLYANRAKIAFRREQPRTTQPQEQNTANNQRHLVPLQRPQSQLPQQELPIQPRLEPEVSRPLSPTKPFNISDAAQVAISSGNHALPLAHFRAPDQHSGPNAPESGITPFRIGLDNPSDIQVQLGSWRQPNQSMASVRPQTQPQKPGLVSSATCPSNGRISNGNLTQFLNNRDGEDSISTPTAQRGLDIDNRKTSSQNITKGANRSISPSKTSPSLRLEGNANSVCDAQNPSTPAGPMTRKTSEKPNSTAGVKRAIQSGPHLAGSGNIHDKERIGHAVSRDPIDSQTSKRHRVENNELNPSLASTGTPREHIDQPRQVGIAPGHTEVPLVQGLCAIPSPNELSSAAHEQLVNMMNLYANTSHEEHGNTVRGPTTIGMHGQKPLRTDGQDMLNGSTKAQSEATSELLQTNGQVCEIERPNRNDHPVRNGTSPYLESVPPSRPRNGTRLVPLAPRQPGSSNGGIEQTVPYAGMIVETVPRAVPVQHEQHRSSDAAMGSNVNGALARGVMTVPDSCKPQTNSATPSSSSKPPQQPILSSRGQILPVPHTDDRSSQGAQRGSSDSQRTGGYRASSSTGTGSGKSTRGGAVIAWRDHPGVTSDPNLTPVAVAEPSLPAGAFIVHMTSNGFLYFHENEYRMWPGGQVISFPNGTSTTDGSSGPSAACNTRPLPFSGPSKYIKSSYHQNLEHLAVQGGSELVLGVKLQEGYKSPHGDSNRQSADPGCKQVETTTVIGNTENSPKNQVIDNTMFARGRSVGKGPGSSRTQESLNSSALGPSTTPGFPPNVSQVRSVDLHAGPSHAVSNGEGLNGGRCEDESWSGKSSKQDSGDGGRPSSRTHSQKSTLSGASGSRRKSTQQRSSELPSRGRGSARGRGTRTRASRSRQVRNGKALEVDPGTDLGTGSIDNSPCKELAGTDAPSIVQGPTIHGSMGMATVVDPGSTLQSTYPGVSHGSELVSPGAAVEESANHRPLTSFGEQAGNAEVTLVPFDQYCGGGVDGREDVDVVGEELYGKMSAGHDPSHIESMIGLRRDDDASARLTTTAGGFGYSDDIQQYLNCGPDDDHMHMLGNILDDGGMGRVNEGLGLEPSDFDGSGFLGDGSGMEVFRSSPARSPSS